MSIIRGGFWKSVHYQGEVAAGEVSIIKGAPPPLVNCPLSEVVIEEVSFTRGGRWRSFLYNRWPPEKCLLSTRELPFTRRDHYQRWPLENSLLSEVASGEVPIIRGGLWKSDH